MPKQSATATGADLSSVLTSVLADLVDDEVRLEVDLPEGVDLVDVRVEVDATIARTDATPAARPHESGDTPPHDGVRPDGPGVGGDDGASDDEPAVDGEDLDRDGAEPKPVEPAAGDGGGGGAGAGRAEPGGLLTDDELDELDEEADAGADFVEGLLDAMDLPGELQIRVLEASRRAEVEVVDMNSGALIGRRGSTLEAIQELMRCALQSQFERRVHVHVDVEGYRARRLEKLLDKADEAIDHVLDTGESERLEPMDVFERKAIHEFVNDVDGVLSRSHGREPSRRIVIEATH